MFASLFNFANSLFGRHSRAPRTLRRSGRAAARNHTHRPRVEGLEDRLCLNAISSDGTLDAGFDDDGKVTTEFSTAADVANSVALPADGKIVAAGYAVNASGNTDFALARYGTHVIPVTIDITAGSAPSPGRPTWNRTSR
jgi:hypothetical protein